MCTQVILELLAVDSLLSRMRVEEELEYDYYSHEEGNDDTSL